MRRALDAGFTVLNIDASTLESVIEISRDPNYNFCQIDVVSVLEKF